MIEKSSRGLNKTNKEFDDMILTKRSQERLARKYVFFDAQTGEVVFEYGGVKPI